VCAMPVMIALRRPKLRDRSASTQRG
jgi:hypothetical protein